MGNRNVSGCVSRGPSSQKDVFAGSCQEVVIDLVRPHGIVADSAIDGLGVATLAGSGDAMEIGKERIDDGDVGTSSQLYSARGFIVGRAVEPDSVINNLAAGASRRRKGIHQAGSGSTRQFQADQAVMTGSRREEYWAAGAPAVHYQFC